MKQFISINQRIGTLLVIFTVLFILGCKNKGDVQQNEEQVFEAEILTLQKESVKVEQTYPANLEGKVNVDIRPQVSGYIEKIFVDEGAFVKAGQPLFKINESVYREQKNTALAALNASKSQLEAARLDLEKYGILSEKKVVADFQYQKAKAAYENAKAAVGQQEALVASSELNMGFTLVKAPVSGYVGRIPKRIGNLVSPTDSQALTTLSQVDVIYAYFSLPETEILNINENRAGNSLLEKMQAFQQIALQMANGAIYGHKGKIDMMDGQIDKSTGAVVIRASFPNPQGLLRSGNTGRIILIDQQADVVRIPVLAGLEMQDKTFVGLLDKDNVVKRVQLNSYTKSGDYYIVKSGFRPGDRIVANELGSIPENVKVKPKQVK
ncbi:efflux RND transporter periplasmic adaptor subunit [Sphingobacterium mizutaii]|uniref:efflux RND transporter periplasmic adaptor subunit n=1 Tax=Sphingobacterium mizutaii TaxID=1010 RepID=UPI001625892D|nr:efflux RND transporter periplasmic adaptor subunit [Sphingobacterium mizutaii]